MHTMETYDEVDQFQCIICLELVYKPIVHACGHLFCFWCVHRAMDGAYKNFCPLCRRPYMHFPRICEQLHFVLLKAVREKYLVRAREVQEEEAQAGIFSPEIHAHPPRIVPLEDTPAGEASSTATGTVSSSNSERGSVTLSSSSSDDSELVVSSKGKAPMVEEGHEVTAESVDAEVAVTTLDLACKHCGSLLYRPVVMNCGHVFCEHCVVVGRGEAVSCPSCKAEHPGMISQVCLELHHYIDRTFPLEYAQRSLQVGAEEKEWAPSSEALPSRVRTSLPGPVHRKVGCDGCGMMPIVGKRFQCLDCPDAIGFDLCQKCHESGCVVGRFNQRHTSEHRMREIHPPCRASTARQFLDAMAHRGLHLVDLRDCDEADALPVLLMQHRVEGPHGNGISVSDPPSADGVVEDGVPDDDVLQDDDDRTEAFMLGHGEDGEFDDHDDEQEFEAFSRGDDEDIDFFRVVFHS